MHSILILNNISSNLEGRAKKIYNAIFVGVMQEVEGFDS